MKGPQRSTKNFKLIRLLVATSLLLEICHKVLSIYVSYSSIH